MIQGRGAVARNGLRPKSISLHQRGSIVQPQSRRDENSSYNGAAPATWSHALPAGGSGLSRNAGAEPGGHLLGRDAPVVVDVERVEHGVGSAPLFARDEAVAVEVVDA